MPTLRALQRLVGNQRVLRLLAEHRRSSVVAAPVTGPRRPPPNGPTLVLQRSPILDPLRSRPNMGQGVGPTNAAVVALTPPSGLPIYEVELARLPAAAQAVINEAGVKNPMTFSLSEIRSPHENRRGDLPFVAIPAQNLLTHTQRRWAEYVANWLDMQGNPCQYVEFNLPGVGQGGRMVYNWVTHEFYVCGSHYDPWQDANGAQRNAWYRVKV